MPSKLYLMVRSVPAIPGTSALGGRPSGDGRVSNHVPGRCSAILAQPQYLNNPSAAPQTAFAAVLP